MEIMYILIVVLLLSGVKNTRNKNESTFKNAKVVYNFLIKINIVKDIIFLPDKKIKIINYGKSTLVYLMD